MRTITTGLDIAKSVFQVHGGSCELQALGRTVRPPAYVKPYVKRHSTDAEVICEASLGQTCGSSRQGASATELSDAASYPSLVHPPAELGDQCNPRSFGRVWHRDAMVSR